MPKSPLAVVTMAHNEIDMLPIWLRYYGQQVGIENCYVLDHHSTDGSTNDVKGAKLIRLLSSPLDDVQRCRFVSDVCNMLLTWYDHVAYTDCDEFLVADPAAYDDLPSLARNARHDVVTTFGMDLLHMEPAEGPLSLDRPILSQRRYVRPSCAECKPLLTRRPIDWGMGFHYADTPSYFDELLLFHLAAMDFDLIRRRQAKRAATAFVEGRSGGHHRMAPDDMVNHMRRDYITLPRLEDAELRLGVGSRADFTKRLLDGGDAYNGEKRVASNIQSETLWRVPDRFQNSL